MRTYFPVIQILVSLAITVVFSFGVIWFWCEDDPIIPSLDRQWRHDFIVRWLQTAVEASNAGFANLANQTRTLG